MKLLPGTTREWIDLSVDGPFLDAANLNDHEAKFRAIDALLQCSAIALQNDPPSSPAQDAVYIVGPASTGVWAAHANKIARFGGVDWDLFSPTIGWKVAVGGIDYRWSGSEWIYSPSLPLESASTLGLGVFGAAGQGTAYAYQILSNRGVGFQDARGVGWKGGFSSSDAYFGIWQDANSSANFKPIVFGDSVNGAYYKSDPLDALFKHRLTGNTKVTGSVEISLNLQIAGINRITSTGEGQFSGLRLTNLSTGQIPVCSDGNSQITASGQTDDGTYFTSQRIFRAWNALTKTGNTWSSMQWNQASEERVSIFSSDSSGSSGYHSLVFVPSDNEATNRELGHTTYAQKVASKSGTNPGLKIVLSGRSVGSGGSIGGFGGQWGIEYRPDNGANLINALRVGVFGGTTADAVQADILLRAAAGLNISGLGSSGSLGVDSSGNVVLQQGARFQAVAESIAGDSVERSILGQPSAKRKIAANSIASGDTLEVVEDVVFYWGGSSTTWNFYIGPDATYTASYRPAYTMTAPDLGTQGYTRRCRLAFSVRFFGSGSSVSAKVSLSISACEDNSYSGTLIQKEFNFTISVDNTSDRFFDLTIAATDVEFGSGSTWSNHLVAANYTKAQ